jgi:transposase-like protein
MNYSTKNKMTLVQEVISRFGGIEPFSKRIGAKKNTARYWWYYAKRFPGKWMPVIVEAAKEDAIPLSVEELAGEKEKSDE